MFGTLNQRWIDSQEHNVVMSFWLAVALARFHG